MNSASPNPTWLNLPNLPAPLRVLFSTYLFAIGLGLCMAGLQIMETHGMADGKFGLSVNDIVYSYYGNRSGSTMENKLHGSMAGMGTPQARLDIIQWVRDGSPEAVWESRIKDTLKNNCTQCHGATQGLPDFTRYDEVKRVSKIDEGASIQALTRSSHIHLFGISLLFLSIGLIFSLAVGVPRWMKSSLVAIPFIFLILDVLSWWLTKWSPHFAWLTLIGGFCYSIASAAMWITSLYQMLILSRNQKVYGNAWEADLRK